MNIYIHYDINTTIFLCKQEFNKISNEIQKQNLTTLFLLALSWGFTKQTQPTKMSKVSARPMRQNLHKQYQKPRKLFGFQLRREKKKTISSTHFLKHKICIKKRKETTSPLPKGIERERRDPIRNSKKLMGRR